jgi:hypothetical protein
MIVSVSPIPVNKDAARLLLLNPEYIPVSKTTDGYFDRKIHPLSILVLCSVAVTRRGCSVSFSGGRHTALGLGDGTIHESKNSIPK